jgi:hypothetical protein
VCLGAQPAPWLARRLVFLVVFLPHRAGGHGLCCRPPSGIPSQGHPALTTPTVATRLFCPTGYGAHIPDANAQTHPASPARAIRCAPSTARPRQTDGCPSPSRHRRPACRAKNP